MKRLLHLLCLLTLPYAAWAEITPVWSTGVAVPGEKVVLYLVDPDVGEDVFLVQERPSVPHASLEPKQPRVGANPLDPNRSSIEVYPLLITPDSPGELRPSAVRVKYQQSGREESIEVPPLPVLSTSAIRWQSDPVPFGVLWHTELRDGYVDQPVRTALKVFLPGDCEAPIPPQLHSVGVKVSAFQAPLQGAPAVVQQDLIKMPLAYAKGQNWRIADFCGVLTPYREGNADIGGKLILQQQQSFFNIARAEVELPVLSLGALPLPPGAPADFAHIVGSKPELSASSTAQKLRMNEAVEVELTVRGVPNVEQMECPEPTDAEAWKLVPATRKPLLGANGEIVGMVFSRLMRPTAEVGGIPSFAFSYFDPEKMEYKRAATRPIPLPWEKSSAAGSGLQSAAPEPPPAGEVPTEEMTDIYGWLSPETAGRTCVLPRWLWYLLYAPALLIVLWLGLRALRRRLSAGAASRDRERELTQLAAESDGLAFLKGAGSCIERHLGTEALSPELRRVLDRRDAEVFRPDASLSLSATEREDILRQLRRALAKLGCAALLLLALPQVLAESPAEKDYRAGQYSRALQWLEQSPVPKGEEALTLYNKGNCEYRLGNSGKAALRYAQALQLDPGLKEAQANLAFIQRKEGAHVFLPLPEDAIFTYLSPVQLRAATIISTALLALGLALLLARRGRRTPGLALFNALAGTASILCATGWIYYGTREVPALGMLAPRDAAYVLNATEARTAADDESPVIVQLKPATPLHLLARRGDRCYVETLSNGTRGWVPAASIAPLHGDARPQPPLILRF